MGLNEKFFKSAAAGASNPFNADIYLDPAQLPASGNITEWSNSGTNGQVATTHGTNGTMTVGTLDGAKCAIASRVAEGKSFVMNPSGTTGRNKYSLYNTQQNISFYCFVAAGAAFNNDTAYPQIIYFANTGANSNDYANTFNLFAWREGLPYSHRLSSQTRNGLTGLTGGSANTVELTNPYPEWTGVGLTLQYLPAGTSVVKMFKNGVKVYTYNFSGTAGQTTNSLNFGGSYFDQYIDSGMIFGDTNYWANTLKTESEIQTVHNYFKANYGL
tara:strand:+ start:435 stop:1250 length:816 start_codon:yes stop_codon:yes gene_type:complete